MYNNYFRLVHNFCVIFLSSPRPWPRWCGLDLDLMHLRPR